MLRCALILATSLGVQHACKRARKVCVVAGVSATYSHDRLRGLTCRFGGGGPRAWDARGPPPPLSHGPRAPNSHALRQQGDSRLHGMTSAASPCASGCARRRPRLWKMARMVAGLGCDSVFVVERVEWQELGGSGNCESLGWLGHNLRVGKRGAWRHRFGTAVQIATRIFLWGQSDCTRILPP